MNPATRFANLRRLIEDRYKGSAADFCRASGVSHSQLSQWTSGYRTIGERAARRIEHTLHMPENALDAAPGGVLAPLQVRASGVVDWSTPADLPNDEFALVDRRAVKLSAGDGKMVFEEEPLPPLAFRAEFLRSKRVTRRENLVIVYAEGDSMEPAIMDGDAVLCDRGQTTIIDGEVYAIDYAGQLKVKRLKKLFDGGLLIVSDNATKHPAETLSADQAPRIQVLGRVLWRGGSL